MNKYLYILGMFAVSAATTPTLLDKLAKDSNQNKAPRQQITINNQPVLKTSVKQRSVGRTTKIQADRRGHFMVSARLNGKKNEVLIDTGATYVAINESTARKIGYKLNAADFKHKMHTANGITYAAAITIGEIKIGKIKARDVQATVLRDNALSTTLLGMSFLKKLDKFLIEGQTLTLKE
ncbi:MAG: TIGR02281 family clan AA aspartic protease [Nitratireductor sp.]